jgi:hypothetical protein
VSATEASYIDVNTTVATIRDDARSWLEQHWNPDLSVDDWWRIVAKPVGRHRTSPPLRAVAACPGRRVSPSARPSPSSARCDPPAVSVC